MARPQEIDFIRDASNDRAALVVNIFFLIKCALLVKAEAAETTELRVNTKKLRLSVRKGANLLACNTEFNALSR
jgi:hypothetical protein